MVRKILDDKTVARRTIMNCLKIEESLASLLRIETKVLRRNIDVTNEEIKKTNKTIKYLIYYLILIDDRIEKCFDIIEKDKDN